MNVLIVDDEIDTLNEIKFYVREYEKISSVTICTNPLQALKESGGFEIGDSSSPFIFSIQRGSE